VLRGAVGSALLLLAGLVYAPVPADSVLRRLEARHDPHHVAVGMVLAFAGLVLLTWAWLSLVRGVTGRPDGVRLSRWAALAWTAPLALAPPLFSRDGWSYVATGWMAGHGFSPYRYTPSILPSALRSGVGPAWRHTTSPYGPIPLLWGAAASHVTHDAWAMLVLDRLLAYAGLLLLALVVPRLAGRAGLDPGRSSAVAIASPLVVAHGIGGLHHDLLTAALMVAALAVTRPGRWWWGALVVGLAAAVKLPGGMAAVGVVLLSLPLAASFLQRLRRTVEVAAVASGALVLTSLVSGLGLGWTRGLTRTADEVPRLAPTALLGRWSRLGLERLGPRGLRLVAELRPERTLEHAGLLALLLLTAWVLVLGRVPLDAGAAVTATGLLVLASVLLSPAAHYWYFLAPVSVLAAATLHRRAELTVLAFVAALGITAVLDPAEQVRWFPAAALVVLLALPAATWVLATRSSGGRHPAADRTPRRTLGRR
jgi:alpha-1,6-mannosyltransferase